MNTPNDTPSHIPTAPPDANESKALIYSADIQRRMKEVLPTDYTEDGILGYGNSSVGWLIHGPDKVPRVLKVTTPKDTLQSRIHSVMTQMAEQIGIPVGHISAYGDGWSIEELVPGRKIRTDEKNSDIFCEELGSYMAQLHGVGLKEIEHLQKNGIPVFDMENEIARTQDCREAVVAKIGSGNWERLWQTFRELIPDIKKLGEFVPTHGDMTHDNVFIDEQSSVTGIIDFGAGNLGPRERDFANLMRMEIMAAVNFPYYHRTKEKYEKTTGIRLNENLIKGLILLKCIRKIVKWENSPKKIKRALSSIMGNNFRTEELNPEWGKTKPLSPKKFIEDKYTLPENGFIEEDIEHIHNIGQQLGPIRPETHTSINIPVCGHQEDKTIFRALRSYTNQRGINPEEFEINLLINSPEETSENTGQYSWDKTLNEIERFRKECPDIQVNIATLRLNKRQQDIGLLRAYITDARVIDIANPEKHIFISHDADTASLPPEYLLRIGNIFRNKSQVHLVGGSIQYSDELMCMFPAYTLATIFRRLIGIRGIKTTGGNTAYRASSYIKSGGYQPTLGLGGEDKIIGEAIKKVHLHEPKNGYVRIGTPGVVVSDARRIIEQLLQNDGKKPAHGFWKNPPKGGKIQRKVFTPDESYREQQYSLQTETVEQHLSEWDVFLGDFAEQIFDEIEEIFQDEFETLQKEEKLDKGITLSNTLGQKGGNIITLGHVKRFQFACHAIGIEDVEIGFTVDNGKQIAHPYISLDSANVLKEKMRNFIESIREKIGNS